MMAKDNDVFPDITFSGDITVNGPMFDIHDNEHVHIGKPINEIESREVGSVVRERNEDPFHFVHPEIDEDESWRIHDAVKRLVAHQKVPEICTYLKELKQRGKVMLPSSPSMMYDELVRLGMPTGDGYSEKHFKNCYMK